MQNSNAGQIISKAPSQRVQANILSASTYFDPPREIYYRQKTITTICQVNNIQSTCFAEAQLFNV